MTVYGHRILSLFFYPKVELVFSGFMYSEKRYRWSDVVSVEKKGGDYNWVETTLLNYPYAVITLKDGAKIKLIGRVLEEQGVKPIVDPMESKSDAYDQLIEKFEMAARGEL